jgi:2-polyprenyl-3-methyl-5-hydroxy-6-metoxy-1,4-benzoquinol methylase
MSIEETQKKLDEYFTGKLEIHGATAKGVDCNGEPAQVARFAELIRVIDPSKPFTVIDYGCGYGAMFDFLHSRGWEFEYYGVDLIEKMIIAGRETHKDYPNAHFRNSLWPIIWWHREFSTSSWKLPMMSGRISSLKHCPA